MHTVFLLPKIRETKRQNLFVISDRQKPQSSLSSVLSARKLHECLTGFKRWEMMKVRWLDIDYLGWSSIKEIVVVSRIWRYGKLRCNLNNVIHPYSAYSELTYQLSTLESRQCDCSSSYGLWAVKKAYNTPLYVATPCVSYYWVLPIGFLALDRLVPHLIMWHRKRHKLKSFFSQNGDSTSAKLSICYRPQGCRKANLSPSLPRPKLLTLRKITAPINGIKNIIASQKTCYRGRGSIPTCTSVMVVHTYPRTDELRQQANNFILAQKQIFLNGNFP